MRIRIATLALAVFALLPFAALGAAESPDFSHDGLQPVKSKKVDTLYRRPGATFTPYTRVALLDCEIAFRKNWQRDQASGGVRVTGAEMDRIRKTLAGDFRKIFSEELGKAGYTITQQPGDDVLVLRPAIIGLDITAPDVLTAGRSRSYATSAGEMTLFLELFDGATGEIIARVVDRRQARDQGRLMWQNAITNRSEADRMLRKWAVLARESLDEAKASSATP
jgi:hypothetical protein